MCSKCCKIKNYNMCLILTIVKFYEFEILFKQKFREIKK